MVKINLFDFQVLLKSAFHPLTPVFVGSWRGQFSTKWRGVSAELSYNTYLRNGWIVIDTGVKSETGTPIVEFSSWEPYVSHSNITFPNILSYKFFFKKAFWRVGFLTRTSVVANEEWAGSLPGYLSVYNNTKRGGFFRKNNWNLFLSEKPMNFITQRFIFFRSDIFNNFYKKNTTFTGNFNKFYLFENIGLLNSNISANLLLTSQFFETIIYSKISRFSQAGIFATSKHLFGSFKKPRKFSLYDILFKMSTLFLLNVERGLLGGFTPFFLVTLRMLISDFVFLFTGVTSGSNSVINFLNKKFITLFENSNLNFSFFLRILGYAFGAIARFLRNYGGAEISVLPNNYLLNRNLTSSKLRLLRQAKIHIGLLVSPLLSGTNTALRDFLHGFAPRFFTKKRANRAVFTKPASFFTRKVGKFVNKGGVRGAALVGTQVYPRLVKYRRKPVTRFKLSLFKKQFSFLHFWMINFFAFFVIKPNSKKLAWMGIRLKFFFRSFLKFLKFYSFTSEYFSLAFKERFGQRKRFLIKFNSLRLYFWFLLKRARGLLSAFWSFSSKLFRNYFTAIDFRITKAFSNFSSLVLGLTKLSGLTPSFEVLSPVKSKLNIFPGEVKALRTALLGLHSSFLSARIGDENSLIFRIRNFLRFTLLIRRAVFYFFNRQLSIIVGAGEVDNKLERPYDLSVSYLLKIIFEKKFFRVFLMPRKAFINFIFRLRYYFTANLSKNSRRTVGVKRLLSLIAALTSNTGSRSVLNKITKTFYLARRLILRRVRKISHISTLGYTRFTHDMGKFWDFENLNSNLAYTKQLFLKKSLIRSSNVVNIPYALPYSFLHSIRQLMRFPLAERPTSSLPLESFQQNSIHMHELKLALVKIRAFITRFRQAQSYRHIISRSFGNFRPFSQVSVFSVSRLEREIGDLFTKRTSGAIILGQNRSLLFNLMHFTLVNWASVQPHWAVKSFNFQALTIYQLAAVVLLQNWERLGNISFLNFFMQMRSVTKTLARRINNSAFDRQHYFLQPVVFPVSFLTKRALNRATYLVNAYYTVAANFTDGKSVDSTLSKVVRACISVRGGVTTGICAWRTFCLRFLPFFALKRAVRKNIVRKWNVSVPRTALVFGSDKRNFQATFLNQRKRGKDLAILSLNLCKCTLRHLNFVYFRLWRNSKHTTAVKFFTLPSNLVNLSGLTGEVRKFFLLAFVRKVLAESAAFDSFTSRIDAGRVQEIAFRKVRAIRKILLRSNARRLGIFPKRSKHLKKMYWKLVNSGKLEPVSPDYINSQRSIFDRRNRHSMELSAQRAKKRFRFTTVKLQFTVKKQLWSQLILLLDRIKKVMRLFRVKIWRRRFYRLFRAGRWSLRKKIKKKFIRLLVKAVYFLQKMYYGIVPVRILTLTARVNLLSFNHVTHNSYVLMRSFYLRVLARVAVLRSQSCLTTRHTFFKEVKLNFIYKFIYWFVKKLSMFLLNLRTIFFNFTDLTNKISVLALTGVRESCAFFRSSHSAIASSISYSFYNPILFNSRPTAQLGSWLAGCLTSSSVIVFSDSVSHAFLTFPVLDLISKFFVSNNAFFVWKRPSKNSNMVTLNWTFLIDRRMNLLKVNGVSRLVGRNLLNKLISKRVMQNNTNLLALRRLNLAINMPAHPYAKLLERVVVGSRMMVKKPKLGFLNKNFARSKLKFQKRSGKVVNRAIVMKRALLLI